MIYKNVTQSCQRCLGSSLLVSGLFLTTTRNRAGTPDSVFTIKKGAVFVETFAIDESTQKQVPAALRAQRIHYAHQSTLARHPGERRAYDSPRQVYYRLHMIIDIYNIVEIRDSSLHYGSKLKNEQQLDRSRAAGSRKLVATGILGPFSATNILKQLYYLPIIYTIISLRLHWQQNHVNVGRVHFLEWLRATIWNSRLNPLG